MRQSQLRRGKNVRRERFVVFKYVEDSALGCCVPPEESQESLGGRPKTTTPELKRKFTKKKELMGRLVCLQDCLTQITKLL